MSALTRPVRSLLRSLREAMSNEGIRRLEASWALGIAADTGLLVVLLVVVFARDGIVAAGALGAVRMVPAVLSGMLAGASIERFRGERVLLTVGLTRAAAAGLCALVIATGGSTLVLFALAAIVAGAGAVVRPTQATLMPAVARSPSELVAANMAWSTGEGLGGMVGPFVAGVLIASGRPELGALAASFTFLASALSIARLRFEQTRDATGGAGDAAGGIRLLDGVRAWRRRPVVGWAMLGVFSQVMTRALMTPLMVVAAIELLSMGEAGVGLLNAALGLGGLVGAVFAISLTRTDRLIRTKCAALAYWGAPIAVIGLLPSPALALAAMVVVGVANAVYDVALFTIFQRGTANDERAPTFSIFEGVVGLGSVAGSILAPVLLATFGIRGALAVTGAILPIVALVIYARTARADRVTVVDEPMLQLLREVPAFAELPLTAFERLVGGLEPLSFAPDETVMREGEPGDRFVVVESGQVEVTAGGRQIHRLGRGAGLGEIALLRRSPRTATVTAVTPVTAFAIPGSCFVAAVSGPAAAMVTERIAAANLRRSAATPAAGAASGGGA
ncbi:MAG TPA: MFS transporter [Candidatus Limnocylindria bacterium]|nr:MFS transporter [Candidatus Limnocylindria bacterium]